MANTTIPSELIQASVALGGSPTTTTQSASDNTTKIATTAYVTSAVNSLIDSAPGTMNTLNEIAAALNDDAAFNTTVTNAIATKLPLGGGTMTGNIALGDNNKAIFGAGDDLQIYHDGGNSVITNSTGNLIIRDSVGGNILIQGLQNQPSVDAIANGAVNLYYSGNPKLATTATGIDVTGVVTGTEFNVGVNYAGKFNAKQSNADAYGIVLEASANDRWLRMGHNGTTGQIDVTFNASGGHSPLEFLAGGSERLHIDTNGKIYMNEGVPFSWTDSSHNVSAEIYGDSSDNLVFRNTASKTERMRIGSTGKITTRGTTASGYGVLEFGTININTNLSDGVVDFAQGLAFTNNVTNEGAWTQAGICATGSSGYNGNLVFGTDGNSSRTSNTITERMRIDSSGNLLVGKTSTSTDVVGSAIYNYGTIGATRDGSHALDLGRNSSDGNIAQFRKDGTAVGSIGVIHGNNLFIGAPSHSGLQFGTSVVYPTGGSTGDANDATVDIGASGQRFKDLYLSGTAKVAKTDLIQSIGPTLQFTATYGYSSNRNWRFLTNNFGSGNWGGFSLERSTAQGGTPSEAMFGITLAGLVGIGVGGASGGGQPSAKLHIKQAADKSEGDSHFRIEGSGYSGFHWLNGTAYYIGQNSNGRQLRMYSGSNEAVGVYLTNGGNSWSSYSDERLKENITDIGSVTEKIKDIRCVTYNRKDVDDENKHETIGFIAQDFIGKFDQVLDESKVLDTDEETRYSIRYTETIPILMKAIQEQQTLIESLTARIETLEG